MSWATAWGLSLLTGVGIPLTVILGVAISPGFLVLSLLLGVVFLRAPYRLWRGVNITADRINESLSAANLMWEDRVNRLEAARVPRLLVEPDVTRKFGHYTGTMRAFLHVRNLGEEPVRRCYGRIQELVWIMSYTSNGAPKLSPWLLFTDRDVYFRWQGIEERYHDFHTEGILEIATAEYGNGQGGWSTHQDTPVEQSISYFEDYYLSLQLAADNAPSQVVALRLRLYSKSRKEGNEIWLEPQGTPPHCDFEVVDGASIPEAEVYR